jgi:RHS repeat-associated protein
LFVEQRATANYFTPYKFSAKEKDEETSYSYFGARYLASDFSFWLSVDPMSDERSWLSPYNYCQWNPIRLIDPTGMIDIEGNDKNGNYKPPKSAGTSIKGLEVTATRLNPSNSKNPNAIQRFFKKIGNFFTGGAKESETSPDNNPDTYVKKGGVRLTSEWGNYGENSVSSLGSEDVVADLLFLALGNSRAGRKSYGCGPNPLDIATATDKAIGAYNAIKDATGNNKLKKNNPNNNSPEDNNKPVSLKVAENFKASDFQFYGKNGDSVRLSNKKGEFRNNSIHDAVESMGKTWTPMY